MMALISESSFCFLKRKSVVSDQFFFWSREGLRRKEISFWRDWRVG
jgi:hypothetical protein